jgi:hypothetical protein
MNAEVLQMISIIAFIVAAVLAVAAVILFFKLDVRAVVDDLSGKKAERQIRELRAQNRKVEANRNGNILYNRLPGTGKDQEVQEESTEKLATAKQTTRSAEEATTLLDNEETTVLAQEEGTTVLEQEEGTTVLAQEEGTTVLAQEEGTTVLAQMDTELSGGYHLLLEEIITHTDEGVQL